MMNKLRYDGQWTNRPRDIANLAAYTAREMERPLNWQVVDITHEPCDWRGFADPLHRQATKRQVQPTRSSPSSANFVDNGGILFTHADLGSEEFNRFAADLSKSYSPSSPLRDLPRITRFTRLITPSPRRASAGREQRRATAYGPQPDGSLPVRGRSARPSAARKRSSSARTSISTRPARSASATGSTRPSFPNRPKRRCGTMRWRLKYAGNLNPEPAPGRGFHASFTGRRGRSSM